MVFFFISKGSVNFLVYHGINMVLSLFLKEASTFLFIMG